MSTPPLPQPTERELEILKVLWQMGEASVREVFEVLRQQRPVAQNTIQAFLRTMEDKGLVTHRTEGRSFIYRPVEPREDTSQNMVSGLLERVFDGAMDQLVASAFSLRSPTGEELERLRRLLEHAERNVAGPARRAKRRREST